MDEARQKQIIDALNSKNVRMPCPRCGSPNFGLVGESFVSIQENPGSFVVGGPVVPTVIVACNQCGYVTQHAQAALGIMKKGASDAGT